MNIANLLPERYKNINIEEHETIGSTNDRALELGKEGAGEITVVTALSQTAGKGRRGRSFYSPKGTGVYLSFLLRPECSAEDAQRLTTIAAVAAAGAVKEVSGYEAGIKWVNDVYVHGKKVCGILTEARLKAGSCITDYVVCGIGFNVKEPEGGFPDEIGDVAGAILRHGDNADEDVCQKLTCAFIARFLDIYAAWPSKEYIKEYRRLSFLLGQKIHTLSEPKICGIAEDIDDDGHLMLRTDAGNMVCLDSGEVSVRIDD